MNKTTPTEHQEQAAFFKWWNIWAKGLPYLAFAIPNGGARDVITGAILKREGVRKGIPDVFVAWPRNGSHGIFLEFKRRTGWCVSKEQKEALRVLSSAGYECHVCIGWEEAANIVKEYAFRNDMGEPCQ